MRTISLLTQKGGTGKSTLCTNITVAATEAGETVLVIDCDKQGTVAEWAAMRDGKPPIVAALSKGKSAQLPDVIEQARQKFSLVIIDTPGEDSPLTHNAMSAADLCLVPIRPTRADGHGGKTTIEALMRGGKRFAFVLNRAPTIPGNSRAAEMAAGLMQIGYLADPVVGLRVDYQDAYGAGQGVTEYAPSSKAADEMRQLWAWIDKETKKKKLSEAAE